MKKLYHILTAFIIMLMAGNSISAQKSVYSFPFSNTEKLPALDVYINMDEMVASYQINAEIQNVQFSDPDDAGSEVISTTYVNDERLIDASRYLKYYMFDQLLEYSDEKYGSVEITVSYYNKKDRISLGTIVTVATLGFSMFFGIPAADLIIDLEVEASFFDRNGQYISRYTGLGHAWQPESLYYQSIRKTHRKALLKALTDLNSQIMADTILMERLK